MDTNKNLNSWETIRSELVYESAWIAVNKHQTINPAGNAAVIEDTTVAIFNSFGRNYWLFKTKNEVYY